MVPLWAYLILAAALFCIGAFGALARRNAIGVLMGIELMLNAVNVNLVAFWRYTDIARLTGQLFAIFVITVAAAEAAVAKWLEGKTVVKAICVPGKLVNLVVK